MDWSNERHVRVFTRDTLSWRLLPWQGKALWPLILRKVDRAGLLPLDGHGVAGLAVIVELPLEEVVEPGFKALLKAGYFVMAGDALFVPNFLEAQEAPLSDAQRQRDSREKRAAAATAAAAKKHVTIRDASRETVTNCDAVSQNVTECHEGKASRTECHSDPARPARPEEDPPLPPPR